MENLKQKITKEIIEIALKFFESAEMVEHLRNHFDTYSLIWKVTRIIAGSRASFEDKLDALRVIRDKVAEYENNTGKIFQVRVSGRVDIAELDKLINAGEFALNEITENIPVGTVFLLGSYFLNKIDDATFDWDLSVPFMTFESAKNRLLKEIEMYHKESGDNDADWKSYTISKWIPATNGEMLNVLTWHISNEGIIWFADINEKFDERLRQLAYDCEPLSNDSHHELSWLTVPYEPGDIITIDCRPSWEIIHAVIPEIIADGKDCCGIQAIHFTEDGELFQSALKHDLIIFEKYPPMFTCMYRLEKFTGELPEWEAPLKRVSEMLKADPSLGLLNNEGEFLSRTNFNERLKN